MPSPEQKTISRRDFLINLASVAGGLIGGGLLCRRGILAGKDYYQRRKAAADFAEFLASLEKKDPLQPILIEGIPVFGAKEPVKDKETIQAIVSQGEKRAFWGRKMDNLSQAEIISQREAVLPLKQRLFEIIVPESVWRGVVEADRTPNFVAWSKNHLEVLNQILAQDVPGVGIESLLKRIIVIDDQLAESITSENEGKGYEIDSLLDDSIWTRDNFGRWPFDVDLRFYFWNNYLENRPWMTHWDLEEGKVKVDKEMLYVWLFMLFPVFPLVEKHQTRILSDYGYLNLSAYKNDFMISPKDAKHLSPATVIFIENLNRFQHRSAFTSLPPPEYESRWFPSEVSFSFDFLDGRRPEIGECFHTQHWQENPETYQLYPTEILSPLPEGIKTQTGVHLNREQLGLCRPYLVVLLDFPERSEPLAFPIPLLISSLASHQEIDKPSFEIRLTEQIYRPEERIALKMVWQKDFSEYLRSHKRIFACCWLPGSKAVHVWEWEKQKLDLRDRLKLLG